MSPQKKLFRYMLLKKTAEERRIFIANAYQNYKGLQASNLLNYPIQHHSYPGPVRRAIIREQQYMTAKETSYLKEINDKLKWFAKRCPALKDLHPYTTIHPDFLNCTIKAPSWIMNWWQESDLDMLEQIV